MKVINLLPNSEKDALQKLKVLGALKSFVFWSFVSYIVVVLGLIGGRVYEEKSLSTLDAQIEEQKQIISKQNDAALTAEIEKDNSFMFDYVQLTNQTPMWSPVLQELADLIPAGVSIQSFNGNTKSGKIDIAGRADTRDAVIQLHDRVAASKTFKSIDMPLENLSKPANLDFHFTILLSDNVLIKK